ncbi:MAG: SPFH domain-containing protein [Firmicutes bacterium]|nr:SPFH domain-containing protein [Bacillota bacterium]
MSLFKSRQFSSVVEWQDEGEPGVLFHRFDNVELKKGSVLIIRPGQNAVFLQNGEMLGIYTEEGRFDLESDIIPFLSTLAGIKYGFDSGKRVEVIFINVKQITQQWGTRSPINVAFQDLPSGVPVRANGTYIISVDPDQVDKLLTAVIGVKDTAKISEYRDRVLAVVEQSLMTHISQKSGSIITLQQNSIAIADEVEKDINAEMQEFGFKIHDFKIASFSYPEEVQKMVEKAAGVGMIGNMQAYQQASLAEGLANGSAAGVFMGMNAVGGAGANGLVAGAGASPQQAGAAPQQQAGAPVSPAAGVADGAAGGTGPKFCPECGTPVNGAKFCSNCGKKLV